MAISTAPIAPTAPRAPISTVDEAEEIAKEYITKKFGKHDFLTFSTTFDGKYFTVSVARRAALIHLIEEHRHEDEEKKKSLEGTSGQEEEPLSEVRKFIFCDVKVDTNGFVVAWARSIRTADEAEAIAKEYAIKRYDLTHFIPYTTTFDGNYYTVYAGGLVYEGGLVRSALKIYKSKFYDVKVDKTGLVVAWTTEGLISHYSQKLQKFR
jgi:hypothetical protein